MKCTKCGTELPEGTQFCSNCGENLGAATAQTATPAPVAETPAPAAQPVAPAPQGGKNNKVLIIIIAILAVLLLVVGGLFAANALGLFDGGNSETKETDSSKKKNKDKEEEKETTKDDEKDEDDDNKGNEKEDKKEDKKEESTGNVTKCTMNDDLFGMKMGVNAYDRNGEIYKLDMIISMSATDLEVDSFDDLSASDKEEFKKEMLDSLGIAEGEKGVDINIEFTSKEINITVSVDLSTASKDVLEELGLDFDEDDDLSIDSFVKDMTESDVMVCR